MDIDGDHTAKLLCGAGLRCQGDRILHELRGALCIVIFAALQYHRLFGIILRFNTQLLQSAQMIDLVDIRVIPYADQRVCSGSHMETSPADGRGTIQLRFPLLEQEVIGPVCPVKIGEGFECGVQICYILVNTLQRKLHWGHIIARLRSVHFQGESIAHRVSLRESVAK